MIQNRFAVIHTQQNNDMSNATNTPKQPLGYINERLTNNTTPGRFVKTQLVGFVVDRNNPEDTGTHPEYIGGRLTKTDVVCGEIGDVICYQKTHSGFNTMEDMTDGDTGRIVVESCSVVYMVKVKTDCGLFWAHIPNHKIQEAKGNPYNVQWAFVPKLGQYIPTQCETHKNTRTK